MVKIPRIMLASFGSGSGKTLMTCALLKSLVRDGAKCVSYKCGPDYIDPLFHQEVIGVPSHNLDLFFLQEPALKQFFVESFEEKVAEIAVVEGVMGLYDGLGGISQEASAYHVAQCLGIPIVLVVNARGMGRSLLPLLAGFLKYDTDGLIRGVLLNQTTASFCEAIRPVLERELGLAVLGYFPVRRDLELESRHLGLKLPGELETLGEKVDIAAGLLEQCVDRKRLLTLAGGAKALAVSSGTENTQGAHAGSYKPVLAVARDEAFCFIYEDNLKMLREEGLKVSFFSPLHDKGLPEGTCGIWLPGGYPELVADRLCQNQEMREEIRCAIESGMPSLAECGGFLYLHELLGDETGNVYGQAGVLSGTALKKERLVRFGYVEIHEKEAHFLPEGESIRGHEFHYYDSDNNGTDCIAQKPVGERIWECIHVSDSHWWGFPHLYFRSNPYFVRHFAEQIRGWQKKGEGTWQN